MRDGTAERMGWTRAWGALEMKVPGMSGFQAQRLMWEPVVVEQVHARSSQQPWSFVVVHGYGRCCGG